MVSLMYLHFMPVYEDNCLKTSHGGGVGQWARILTFKVQSQS